MLIMLVDHVREHFFSHHTVTDPMVIHEVSASLFFTRLSTHLCAPVFVFLTGLSAWLYANPANKPPRQATSFLLKRGLFLLFLEVTLINFSWSASYHTLYLQVIWAIGISMFCLAFLSRAPRSLIGVLGLVIVFGHNFLTPITFDKAEVGYNFWTMLHDRGYLAIDGLIKIRVSYPVLPWIGVILLGYFAGPLYHHQVEKAQRKQVLLWLGFAMLTLLLVLRGFNIYGETLPWAMQPTVTQSVMSFLNYTKYPPSLQFLLFILGVGCLLLAYFENVQGRVFQVLKVYGSAPMFFYIVHLYTLLIVHGVLLITVVTQKGETFKLNAVYQLWLISIALAVLLYFPTQHFSSYKRRSTSKLIKYF